MTSEEPVPWEGNLVAVAARFAEDCAQLRDTYPYADVKSSPPLEQVIAYLATELWDQDFGMTEIKNAFDAAVKGLPRYASGWEKRSDESRSRTAAPS